MKEIMMQVPRLNLSSTTAILVRFHFTNPAVIPQGLRSVERPSEQQLIQKRMKALGVNDEKETRGVQVLQDIERVQIAAIRTGLANNSFRLVDAHTSKESRHRRPDKYITTLGFRRLDVGEVAPEIPTEAMSDLRALSTNAVYLGHIWANPNGVIVIELMMRQPGVTPKCAFAIRKGGIVVVQTDVLLEENNEDIATARELLQELESLRVS